MILVGVWFLALSGCSSSGGGKDAGGGGASGNAPVGGTANAGAGASGTGNVGNGGAPAFAGAAPVAPPFVSDPDGSYTSELQLVNGYLYWLSGTHKIVRAAVDGTGVKAVFSHPVMEANIVAIGGFAVDPDNLYFTDSGDGDTATRGVYKIALDGSGTATKLADGVNPAALALAGDTLCFVDGSSLLQVKTSGGAVTTLVRGGMDYRTPLVILKSYVYFPSARGGALAADMYRWPLGVAAPPDATAGAGGANADSAGAGGSSAGAGGSSAGAGGSSAGAGAPQKLSTVSGTYDIGIATQTDADTVYWFAAGNAYKWADGATAAREVDSISTSGSRPPPLLPYDGAIYWVQGATYKEQVSDKTRSTVSNLAPSSLAADGSYVYGTYNKGIVRFPR